MKRICFLVTICIMVFLSGCEIEDNTAIPHVINELDDNGEMCIVIETQDNFIAYSIDDGVTFIDVEPTKLVEIVGIDDGVYDVQVMYYTENISNNVAIEIDSTSPLITSIKDYSNDGNFVVSSNEEFVAYSVDNGETYISVESTKTYQLSGLQDGYYSIRVKDSFDNISESKDILVDTVEPEVMGLRIYEEQLIRKIVPIQNDLDLNLGFGFDIDTSGDMVAVGSPYDRDENNRGRGSIYVYDLSKQPDELGYELKIIPSNEVIHFGGAVGIYENKVITYSRDYNDNDIWYIYLYDITKETTEEGYETIIASGVEKFSDEMAIYGNYIVIRGRINHDNNGYVLLYDLTKDLEDENFERILTSSDGKLADFFGNSVDIYENLLVVGAFASDNPTGQTGCVYVYDLSLPEDHEDYETKIVPSDSEHGDFFGYHVGIYEKELVVVASSMDFHERQGVYLYDLTKEQNEEGFERILLKYKDAYATFRDVFIYENYVVLGSRSVDHVSQEKIMVFNTLRENNQIGFITYIGPYDKTIEDYFGCSVAIVNDKFLVGAFNNSETGSVYMYELNPMALQLEVTDDNDFIISVTKDNEEYNFPFIGIFTEKGTYRVEITDEAQNKAVYGFTID